MGLKKFRIIKATLFLVSLIGFLGQTLVAAPPDGYPFLSLTQAMKKSVAEKIPMFLYFGRYGCTTCRKMHEEVFIDSGLNKQFSKKFALAYVDTESGNRIRLSNGERTTEMQFASRSRILGTPTFIYFSADQKPLFKRAGFQTIEQMTLYNDYVLEGHYRTAKLKDYMANK